MTPGAKLRTALIAGLAVWAGIEWYTDRDDARVEKCREAGIESQARLDRCRESLASMRDEIKAKRDARWREQRRQVLQRFANARRKLGHPTTYQQEAVRADGNLPTVLEAAGLEKLDILIDIEERDPERIRNQAATIDTRLEVEETEARGWHYTLVWTRYDDADSARQDETGENGDVLSLVYADVSALTKAERTLIRDACTPGFADMIYDAMGCPVVVAGSFDLKDLTEERANQLTPERVESSIPFRTLVFEIERIRFQEPPKRVERPNQEYR